MQKKIELSVTFSGNSIITQNKAEKMAASYFLVIDWAATLNTDGIRPPLLVSDCLIYATAHLISNPIMGQD